MCEISYKKILINKIKDEYINIFNMCFKNKIDINYFEWKYISNPHYEKMKKIYAAFDENDNVIGCRPYICSYLKYNNNIIKCSQPCDSIVKPQYRNNGIFSNLNKLFLSSIVDNDYQMCFNFPNNNSFNTYIKNNWQLHIKYKYIIYPINLFKYGNINKTLLYNENNYLNDNIRINIINNISDYWKELSTCCKQNQCMQYIDKKYLNWRCDDNPSSNFVGFIIEKNNVFIGYAIIELLHYSIFNVALLFECNLTDDNINFKSIFNIILITLKNINCNLFIVWNNDNNITTALNDYYHISSNIIPISSLKKEINIVYKLFNNNLDGIISNWQVYPISSDSI